MIGEVVAGRYVIESYLGGGGMGQVWLARDNRLTRRVALKFPRSVWPPPDRRSELVERMRREAVALARLDHPGIVRVHDVLELDGGPCIVMAYVPGTTLGASVKAGGLPEAAVTGIGLMAAEALTAAHAENVFHRDVKPDNIVLTRTGRAVLVDFGIAAIDGQTGLTHDGTIIGTLDYIAPERLRGEPAAPASDLWSLGATLYAALQGRPPFRRETTDATKKAIKELPPHPPDRPSELTDIIGRLLDKNARSRMRGPELAAALTRLRTRPPNPTPRPTRPNPPETAPRSAPGPARRPAPGPAPGRPAPAGPSSPEAARPGAVRRAREALAGSDAQHAAARLATLSPADAAALLAQPRFTLAGPVMDGLCRRPAELARILQMLLPPRAGQLMDQVSHPDRAADVLLHMDDQPRGRILDHMTDRHASRAIERMVGRRPASGTVIVKMTPDKAGDALRHLDPDLAADLLTRSPPAWRDQVLPYVTDAIRARVRRRLHGGR